MSFVKKAAKLAVYDEITISAKNHQMAAPSLVGTALLERIILENGYLPIFDGGDWMCATHLGRISQPCCIIEPTVSQIQLCMFQIFSNSSASSSHGCGFSQSAAAILWKNQRNVRSLNFKDVLPGQNY